MKKTYLAAIICALVSSAALAQTAISDTVQLYGSVDAGIDYVTNSGGGHLWALNSGKRSPDRFGFRGTEDLGGGYGAFFRIETGFNLKNGTQANPNTLFNRYAQVGLVNKGLGTLALGHMPDFLYEYLASFSNAVPGLSSSFTPGNLDNLANQFQLDNAIKYESPSEYPVQFGAMNGFGEQPGNFSQGRRYSFGARYGAGPLRVAGAYAMYHNRPADLRTIFGLTSLLGQTLSAGTQFNTTKFRTAGAGAVYNIGIFSPHALVTDVRLENTAGSESLRNYQVGVNIDISGGGKVDQLGLSYDRSTFANLGFKQYNVFLGHALSRRTQIYAGAAMQRADGRGAVAEFTGYRASTTDRQSLFRVGVHHLF